MSVQTAAFFRETSAQDARSLTDGVRLTTPASSTPASSTPVQANQSEVIMPWMGFGTYRLGKGQAQEATFQALQCGYRSIDTAFIYGGETTERLVGKALRQALKEGVIKSREELFITTKHWRKYHGYDATLECLRLSLSRLDLEYVDLWLMHWPGPAYDTLARRKDVLENNPWHYATTSKEEMVSLRAETWRAMEDAYRKGLVRAIGVSNMSVEQLKSLKAKATIWPPAVNQVELHPLYPQTELREYCRQEGIRVQAYASLGGQDTGKTVWSKLLGVKVGSKGKLNLRLAGPVVEMAKQLNATPAQTLLRWGLERDCLLIPKTMCKERLLENAGTLNIVMSATQVEELQENLRFIVAEKNPDDDLESLTRLCWRSDPLRHLDFD